MDGIVVKKADNNILKELQNIDFDKSYVTAAREKYCGCAYKIFALKPYEANILKQICLSLGFDCAVSRNTVTCKCDYTDCIIFGSISQLKKLVHELKKQPFRLKTASEELEKKISCQNEVLTVRNTLFDWTRPYIMGILNVTPDSFSDGGKYTHLDNALSQVQKMICGGADIIDIGGESTRPGAITITVSEEIDRVIPVIKRIREMGINTPISVDTRNYETGKEAIKAGADIINDVSGLEYDNNLFEFISKNNIPVVIMHSDKVPAVSSDFSRSDIVEEVYLSLNNKINNLLNAGMERCNIIADTGIGFGKSVRSNFELLKRMEEFTSLNVPLLLGISRKSFIRNTFNINFEDADIASALYSAAVKGINIHRVHNVELTKKYLNFMSEII